MQKYFRVCKTVRDRGRLVPYEQLKASNSIKELTKDAPEVDWYSSLYYYDESVLEYFDKNNSISGFSGSALSNRLLFDFDSHDLKKAQEDAITLLGKLNKLHKVDVLKHVRLYFSGNKGYHVELLLEAEYAPEELKFICKNLAEGLVTFDAKVYDSSRLIRLPNTKHQVSGLYKVPIELFEFKKPLQSSMNEIASTRRFINDNIVPLKDVGFLEEYKKLMSVAPSKPSTVIINSGPEDIRGLSNIDFNKCPSHMPLCVYALQKGVMVPGERNTLFVRLATYYRNQGLPREVAGRMLKGVAELNAKLYPESDIVTKEEIWNSILPGPYKTKYSYNPDGVGTSQGNEDLQKYCAKISKYCDKDCCLHGDKLKNVAVKIDNVFDSFSSFAEGYDHNRVKTGIHFIDRYMHISTGTSSLIVGASGSGKTTLLLNILENASALGIYSMFFSLDMHKHLILIKLAQKLTDYTQEEVIGFFKNRDEEKKREIYEIITKTYSKTFFDFTGTLTMDDMKNRVLQTREKHGKDIKLVAVDYASRISGPHSDRYANATYNALRSKEVASDTDAAWIILSQVGRNTGDGSTPLRTKRAAKESGDWEEAATNVITMWRPYMGLDEQDNIVRLFLAKNRMGRELERPLWWDGAKATITTMSHDEYEEYVAEREASEIEVFKNKFLKR